MLLARVVVIAAAIVVVVAVAVVVDGIKQISHMRPVNPVIQKHLNLSDTIIQIPLLKQTFIEQVPPYVSTLVVIDVVVVIVVVVRVVVVTLRKMFKGTVEFYFHLV